MIIKYLNSRFNLFENKNFFYDIDQEWSKNHIFYKKNFIYLFIIIIKKIYIKKITLLVFISLITFCALFLNA
jgi:hypothetical protein